MGQCHLVALVLLGAYETVHHRAKQTIQGLVMPHDIQGMHEMNDDFYTLLASIDDCHPIAEQWCNEYLVCWVHAE